VVSPRNAKSGANHWLSLGKCSEERNQLVKGRGECAEEEGESDSLEGLGTDLRTGVRFLS